MMMKTKISNDELAGIRSLDELRRMRQRIELQTMLTTGEMRFPSESYDWSRKVPHQAP